MYDYADFLDKLLGIQAPTFCCIRSNQRSDENVFRARFGNESVRILDRWPRGANETDALVRELGVSHIYFHKGGWSERRGLVLSTIATNLVHCVFNGSFPHGERHARISPAVIGESPVVPYMVRPPRPGRADMRKVLSIGEDVTVIGRYGGIDSFDFPFVQTALIEESFPGMLFLFVNTIRFCVPASKENSPS